MDMEQVGFAELEELERAIAAAEADPPPETPAAPTNAPKMDEDEELDEDAALLAALEEAEKGGETAAGNEEKADGDVEKAVGGEHKPARDDSKPACDEEVISEEDLAMLDALDAAESQDKEEVAAPLSKEEGAPTDEAADEATEPPRELSWKELKAQAEAAEAAAEAAEAAAEAAEAAKAAEAVDASPDVATGRADIEETAKETAEETAKETAKETAEETANAELEQSALRGISTETAETDCIMECSEPNLSAAQSAGEGMEAPEATDPMQTEAADPMQAEAADPMETEAADPYDSEHGSGYGNGADAAAEAGAAAEEMAEEMAEVTAAAAAEMESLPDLEEEPEDISETEQTSGGDEPKSADAMETYEDTAEWARSARSAAAAWASAEAVAEECAHLEEAAPSSILRECSESEANVQRPVEEVVEEWGADGNGGFTPSATKEGGGEEVVAAEEEKDEAADLDLQGRQPDAIVGSTVTVWYLEGSERVGYVGKVLGHERSQLEVQFDNQETIFVTAEDEWRWGDHTTAAPDVELSQISADEIDVDSLPPSSFVRVYVNKKGGKLKMDSTTLRKVPLRDAHGKVHLQMLRAALQVLQTGTHEGAAVFVPEQTRMQVRSLDARVMHAQQSAAEQAEKGKPKPSEASGATATPSALGDEYAGWTRKESKSHRGHWYLRSPGGKRKVWEAQIKQQAKVASQKKTVACSPAAEAKEYPAPRKLHLEEEEKAADAAADAPADGAADAPAEATAESSGAKAAGGTKRKGQGDAKGDSAASKKRGRPAKHVAEVEAPNTTTLEPKLRKKLLEIVPTYQGRTAKVTFGDVLDRLHKDLGTDTRHPEVKPLVKRILVENLLANRA